MSFNPIPPMFLLLLLFYGTLVSAQQPYINNHQLDCNDPDPTAKGNLCNGEHKSCESYVTLRPNPPYNSPAKIARLLGNENLSPLIASINNISSELSTISSNKPVVIPVNCSCYKGLYYQYNASYTIQFESENYFTIANNTYQGLTTCQALTEQNPYEVNNLYAGLRVNVPLRCACPTRNQSSLGIKYIISYLVNWGDYVYKIAEFFK